MAKRKIQKPTRFERMYKVWDYLRKNTDIINLWKRRKFIIKSIIKIILEIVKKKKNENYVMHYLL